MYELVKGQTSLVTNHCMMRVEVGNIIISHYILSYSLIILWHRAQELVCYHLASCEPRCHAIFQNKLHRNIGEN